VRLAEVLTSDDFVCGLVDDDAAPGAPTNFGLIGVAWVCNESDVTMATRILLW